MEIVFIYFVISAIIFLIWFTFLCKYYNKHPHRSYDGFNDYFFEEWFGLVLITSMCWPLIIAFSPLLILIGIVYLIARRIKKHYNIE